MAKSKGPVTARKTGKRKKTASGRKTTGGSGFFRVFFGLFLLVLIVTGTGLLARHFFPPEKKPKYEVVREKHVPIKIKRGQEIYSYKNEDVDLTDKKPADIKEKERPVKDSAVEKQHDTDVARSKDYGRTGMPRVGLIIDDIGYDRDMVRKIAAIDKGITFSILPHSPHRREIASYARKKGMEVMLHLPMEPEGYPKVDPGPGALLMSQDPDTLVETLKGNLESVPGIVGVNNHMGSKMTSESTKMYQIFTVLKKKGLFFVDSRTVAKSVCRPSAALFQVPYAERDVFLDHDRSKEAIRRQLKTLVKEAEQKGTAIGIGHPHEETYQVLVEEYQFLSSRVKLVPVSALVKPAG